MKDLIVNIFAWIFALMFILPIAGELVCLIINAVNYIHSYFWGIKVPFNPQSVESSSVSDSKSSENSTSNTRTQAGEKNTLVTLVVVTPSIIFAEISPFGWNKAKPW
jgi:hypothetical protein